MLFQKRLARETSLAGRREAMSGKLP